MIDEHGLQAGTEKKAGNAAEEEKMRFLNEKEFLEKMKPLGIAPCDEGRRLCYEDEEKTLGFDFTNLAVPESAASLFERQGAGDRSVEYAMVGAMFKIMEALGLFPLYLYASDEEWAGEDVDGLVKRRLLTAEEGELLSRIMDEGHGMDAIALDGAEVAEAVRLVASQLTTLGATCHAVDEKGRALVLFSQDEEVSFNTCDKYVYEKAKAMVKSLENTPFDVVFVEDI